MEGDDGEAHKLLEVTKNYDAFLHSSERNCGQCAMPEQSSLGLKSSAIRFSEQRASVCGSKRFGS